MNLDFPSYVLNKNQDAFLEYKKIFLLSKKQKSQQLLTQRQVPVNSSLRDDRYQGVQVHIPHPRVYPTNPFDIPNIPSTYGDDSDFLPPHFESEVSYKSLFLITPTSMLIDFVVINGCNIILINTYHVKLSIPVTN